jgi:hypothetical protein
MAALAPLVAGPAFHSAGHMAMGKCIRAMARVPDLLGIAA